MGKRIVSILLIPILLLQMLPCAAFAETVLYAYPEVNAYLAADKMEQYEREYRLWAADLIRKYRYEYARLTDEHDFDSAWNALYKEYWNAAKLKTGFIRQLGDELKTKIFFNSSAETILTYAETGKTEEYYMYVFLESLEEAVKVDPDLKEQYEALPKKERIYMTIDLATGALKKDVGLEAAEKAADEQFYADLRTLGTDIAVLAANVAYYYLNPMALKEKIITKDTSNVIAAIKDVVLETLEAGLENAIDDVLKNEKNKLENGVKSDLASDFAGKMMTVNTVTLEYVEQAYLKRFEYGDQTPDWGNIEDVARKFVRMAKENSEELTSLAAEEAKIRTAASAEEVLDLFGMELEGILKGSEIVALSLVEASRAGIFEVIDQFKSLVKKKISGEPIATDRKKSRDFLVSIVEGVFNLVQNLVDKGFSAATAVLREKMKNDEQYTALDMLTVMGEYIAKNFEEEAVKQFIEIIYGIIPDGTDIFEYADMKSDTMTFDAMLWGMLYQVVNSGSKSVLLDLATGKNDTNVASGVKGLGSILKVASEAEKELESQTETLEQLQERAAERAVYWEKEMIKDANAARQAGDDEQAFRSRQDYYFSQEERDLVSQAGEELKQEAKTKKSQTTMAQIGSALGEVWGDMMEVSQSLRDTFVSGTLAANNDAAVGLELARMESAYRASLAMEIEATHRTVMYYDTVKFDGSVTYSITYTPEEQKRLGLSSPYYEYTTLDDALKISGFLSPEYILNNPKGTSINDIKKIISMIFMQIKYDIVGANIYDSIVMKEKDVARAAYIKYAKDNHTNIYGSKGLLPYSSAHQIYNSIVECQSWFGESGAYKEEWDVLFE